MPQGFPGSNKTENTPITAIGVIGAFSVWPLPKVENLFWNQIWNEMVNISLFSFLLSFEQQMKISEPAKFFTFYTNVGGAHKSSVVLDGN